VTEKPGAGPGRGRWTRLAEASESSLSRLDGNRGLLAAVGSEWEALVGPVLAQKIRPASISRKELIVEIIDASFRRAILSCQTDLERRILARFGALSSVRLT
jgi:hypothetical protein